MYKKEHPHRTSSPWGMRRGNERLADLSLERQWSLCMGNPWRFGLSIDAVCLFVSPFSHLIDDLGFCSDKKGSGSKPLKGDESIFGKRKITYLEFKMRRSKSTLKKDIAAYKEPLKVLANDHEE